MPADVRAVAAQDNGPRFATPTGNLGNRFVVAKIPAAQIEAIEDDSVSVLRVALIWDRPVRGHSWRAALREGETRPPPQAQRLLFPRIPTISCINLRLRPQPLGLKGVMC